MKKDTSLQVINTKLLTEDSSNLLATPVKIRQLKDAKRLLSKLITEFQKGTIKSREAKDLCYLIVSYVNIAKDIDLEERIKSLEENLWKTLRVD